MSVNIYRYFFCQFINLAAAVISVSVVAIVGKSLAPSAAYATLPYGMQFLAVFLMTYPASMIMQRFGRRCGFLLGAVFLFVAGVSGFVAIENSHFILLIIAHVFLGLFVGIANFYRFAVTDGLDEKYKSRALSLVVAGGVLAAIVAPVLVRHLQIVEGYQPFSFCYLAMCGLAVFNVLLVILIPNREMRVNAEQQKLSLNGVEKPLLYSAVLASALGVGVMNLIMIQSSLHLNHLSIDFDQVSKAIQWHVLAMFVPSFFTGYLIEKTSHFKVIATGMCLFVTCLLVNVYAQHYNHYVVALIVLGLAWNFCFVGGSALLTVSYKQSSCKEKLQGVNDTVVAIAATIGAFLPSVFNASLGWVATNVLVLLLCCIGFVFLLIWFVRGKNYLIEGCR